MNTLVITPTSEADFQLLTALCKKMRIKAEVVPAPTGSTTPARRSRKITVPASPDTLVPRNQAERNLVEAIEEMKEIMAGRKQAISLEEFWEEVRAE